MHSPLHPSQANADVHAVVAAAAAARSGNAVRLFFTQGSVD